MLMIPTLLYGSETYIKMVWTCDADARRYLRKCYKQKWRENDQEEDPEPDG